MKYAIRKSGKPFIRWEVVRKDEPEDPWDHDFEAFTRKGAIKVVRFREARDKENEERENGTGVEYV